MRNKSNLQDQSNLPTLQLLEPRLLLTAYVVDSTLDVVADDGLITLREAIEAANSNSAVTADVTPGSTTETDTITFDPALTASDPATITLNGTQLEITESLDITGPGQNLLTIDANNTSRAFFIDGTDTYVEIASLTVTNGYSSESGGGIHNYDAKLTLDYVTVTGNSANNGGGVYSGSANLKLHNSTISDNFAQYRGGGVYNYVGAFTADNTTISDNEAFYGAGINFFVGSYVITDSIITGNTAQTNGGAICNNQGTLDISDTDITNNSAGNDGGGIYHDTTYPLHIDGGSIANNSAEENGGGVAIENGPLSSISNAMIDKNVAGNHGGGLFTDTDSVTVEYTMISGNHSGNRGGGISIYDYSISVINSVIVGNSSSFQGGGIFGGPTIVNSTVVGNWAARQGGGLSGGSPSTYNSIIALNEAPEDPDQSGMAIPSSSQTLVGVDPQFVRNPDHGGDGWYDDPDTPVDESVNNDYGDLQLTDVSIALNYGDDAMATDADGNPLTTDILGNPRIANGQVDAGAYEFQGTISPLIETPSTMVTTLTDIVDTTDGLISLREAILYNNTLQQDISFAQSVAGGTITLNGSQLSISQSMVIDATSAGGIAIDAVGLSRVMNITGQQVALLGLTITGGYTLGGGGGIAYSGNDTGTLNLTNMILIDNYANEDGGAISNNRGHLTITNSVVVGNETNRDGGGIKTLYGSFTLNNSTVTGNASIYHHGQGGGIRSYNSTTTLNNSIVTLNTTNYLNYNIYGGYTDNNTLINVYPKFVRNPSDGGDGWIDNPDTPVDESANNDYGDLHLRLPADGVTPSIDTGNNTLIPADEFDLDNDGNTTEPLPIDLDGNARVVGGIVDIGAYEWSTAPLLGDANNDGTVGLLDLDILGSNWGQPGTLSEGDFNADGTVGLLDLDILGQNWGNTAPMTTQSQVLWFSSSTSTTHPLLTLQDNTLIDEEPIVTLF